jgi:hypothetical protein
MKKFIPLLLIVVFLVYPSIGSASYKITLKNGSTLYAAHYWEEGAELTLYTYGGILGIQRDSVRKIEESDIVVRDVTPSVSKPAEDMVDADEETKGKAEEKPDINYYKEKKSLLKTELDGTLERLREATKNKDPEAKKKARAEMREISTQIYDLTDELKEKNDGELPEDWWEEQ